MKHSISAAVVGPLERWGWAKGKSFGPQTHTKFPAHTLPQLAQQNNQGLPALTPATLMATAARP